VSAVLIVLAGAITALIPRAALAPDTEVQ